MQMDDEVRKSIYKGVSVSLVIYALPIALLFLTFSLRGQHPWQNPLSGQQSWWLGRWNEWGITVFMVVLGLAEFFLGLYDNDRWNGNEKLTDIVCFAFPKIIVRPFFTYFSLKVLPFVLPRAGHVFHWVPFWWGFFIICIADDLTQYWYHRLHHQLPWMWRFHRTHHSAPYMGMSMASRQNAFYTIFFSQTYLTSALIYLGLGPAALVVQSVKSMITTLAHSSIPWDKPLYQHRVLHPVAWVLERLISTPATHHAHHADSTDDGIGYYKGNFGNMFFLWDVLLGTAYISRRYPQSYGISHYEGDPWYAQFLWPVLKSNVGGSELAADGPMVKMEKRSPDYSPATESEIVIGTISQSVCSR